MSASTETHSTTFGGSVLYLMPNVAQRREKARRSKFSFTIKGKVADEGTPPRGRFGSSFCEIRDDINPKPSTVHRDSPTEKSSTAEPDGSTITGRCAQLSHISSSLDQYFAFGSVRFVRGLGTNCHSATFASMERASTPPPRQNATASSPISPEVRRRIV